MSSLSRPARCTLPALVLLVASVGGTEAHADPYADEVVSYSPGIQGGFNSGNLSAVLGPPQGAGLFQGSLDVVSLGLADGLGGGEIVLAFRNNRIVDGPGVDFTVFENSFLEIGAGSLTAPPFAEPGLVSVSQDGETWLAFSACPIDDDLAGPYWSGCAGISPVLSDDSSGTPPPWSVTSTPIEDLIGVPILSFIPPGGTPPAGAGGDSFDLAEVGLSWARYVKIRSASYPTGPVGANNAGFDLDAVVAVHSEAEVPALSGSGRGALVLLMLGLALCTVRRRR